MRNKDKEKVHSALCEYLAMHSYFYYVMDKPITIDRSWDAVYAELSTLEATNPHLKKPYSPTQHVDQGIYKAYIKHFGEKIKEKWDAHWYQYQELKESLADFELYSD